MASSVSNMLRESNNSESSASKFDLSWVTDKTPFSKLLTMLQKPKADIFLILGNKTDIPFHSQMLSWNSKRLVGPSQI